MVSEENGKKLEDIMNDPNYDGQGKTFQEEIVSSSRITGYIIIVAFIVAVAGAVWLASSFL